MDSGASNYGTVFELSSPAISCTWNETVLYNLEGYTNDGAYPSSGLISDSKGNLWDDRRGREAALAENRKKRFEFAAATWNANLAGLADPVPVTLTIGSNTGTDSIRRPNHGW